MWDHGIRQRCTTDGKNTLHFSCKDNGNYLEVTKQHSWFDQFERNHIEVHQTKLYGDGFNCFTVCLCSVKSV